MQNPEYWEWIRRIWQNPIEGHIRLVFADWLDEHGMPSAAKRQRRYGAWVTAAVEMVLIVRVEQVYFRVKKDGPYFRIKKDGSVHPMPKNTADWNFNLTKHTLKGG